MASVDFKTDFSKHTIPYSEIFSGGPRKDGIPAIDQPRFVTIVEADKWLSPKEAVIIVEINHQARAYPIQILIWHEIVNDTLGGAPISVTYCPLCNTAIVFERSLEGRTLDFGTTGRLRYSNLLMYDRQTESWWQQGNGTAVIGELFGKQLKIIPAAIVSWEMFKATFPQGDVLSKETGAIRDYGSNPYVRYDNPDTSPFLYRGPQIDNALKPLARVLAIDRHGSQIAFAYDDLQKFGVANETVGGEPIVVFWRSGVNSPLDHLDVSSGKEIGSALSFSRKMGGETLTFKLGSDGFIDDQSHGVWNFFGIATDGKYKGKQLEPIVGINHFWFSWFAFNPSTRVWKP
jgi:hypothetical protein